MRRSIVMLAVLVIAVLLPSIVSAQGTAVHPPGVVYAEGKRLMVDGQPYTVKGFNYLPRDYGWTSWVDWDWAEVETELTLAASYGANTIRTGLTWDYFTGVADPDPDRKEPYAPLPEHLAALDRLLAIADRHGLKVILWLPETVVKWMWEPQHIDVTQRHLATWVPRYRDDPRIAAWDLSTDIDGAIMLPPDKGGWGGQDLDMMVTYLRNVASIMRELDPSHLLGIGYCWPSSDIRTAQYVDVLLPQYLGGDQPDIATSGKFGEYDEYIRSDEVVSDREAAVARLVAKVHEVEAKLPRPMPLVMSEFGTYTAAPNSPAIQAAVYETVLEAAFGQLEVAGTLNWVLTDFVWPPKAYTHVSADSPINTPVEQTFGAFDRNYRPKPAAEVARAFYADTPTITLLTQPDEVRLTFDRSFVPADTEQGSIDTRRLTAMLDAVTFYSADNKALLTLDIGTDAARRYLASGFHGDETDGGDGVATFCWGDGNTEASVIRIDVPPGATRMAIKALPGVEDMHMGGVGAGAVAR